MPPGLLISAASGEIRELPSLHLPLGTVSSADLEIEIAHYDAEPHDLVLCLSDGLPETRDPRGELFGMARAKQALTEAPSAERFDRLLKALDDFRGFQQSADDVSLVAVTFGAALDWVIEF
jgi:serine phosphatase RsbU (regulator of sigma subunit)